MWDLVVVGAGPAGASAALAALQLRPGARVLLLDRADFPRDKACGDGIAPHAVDVLAGLGVDAIPSDPPVRRLRLGFVTGLPVSREMQRPAYVVRRADFDARLASAARESGATLRRHQVRSLDIRADHVLVDGEPARVVIGADGANGVIRRLAGVPGPRAGTVALAIRGYAPVEPDCAGEQVITFAEHGWPAYAWSFPLGDGTANVGYGEVVTAGRSPGRAELIARLELLLPGAGAHATSWRAHHLPLSSGRPRQPDGRVLLAGDALSLVNPLTGEGIYYAVLSGALAGRAAVDREASDDPGRAYRIAIQREIGRHLRHTTVVARLARHRKVVDAGIAAARRRQAVFDDLVELGLGRGPLTPRVLAGLIGR
jgi:geranylgeranyl reductase family protein